MRKSMAEVNRHWNLVIQAEIARQIVIQSTAEAQRFVAASRLQHSQVRALVVSTSVTDRGKCGPEALAQLRAALSAKLALCTRLRAVSVDEDHEWDWSRRCFHPGVLPLEALPATVKSVTIANFHAAISRELAASVTQLSELSVSSSCYKTLSLFGSLRSDDLLRLQDRFERIGETYVTLADVLRTAPNIRSLSLHGVTDRGLSRLLESSAAGPLCPSLQHLTVSLLLSNCDMTFVNRLPSLVSLAISAHWRIARHISADHLHRALEQGSLPRLSHVQLRDFFRPPQSSLVALQAECDRRGVSLDAWWL